MQRLMCAAPDVRCGTGGAVVLCSIAFVIKISPITAAQLPPYFPEHGWARRERAHRLFGCGEGGGGPQRVGHAIYEQQGGAQLADPGLRPVVVDKECLRIFQHAVRVLVCVLCLSVCVCVCARV